MLWMECRWQNEVSIGWWACWIKTGLGLSTTPAHLTSYTLSIPCPTTTFKKISIEFVTALLESWESTVPPLLACKNYGIVLPWITASLNVLESPPIFEFSCTLDASGDDICRRWWCTTDSTGVWHQFLDKTHATHSSPSLRYNHSTFVFWLTQHCYWYEVAFPILLFLNNKDFILFPERSKCILINRQRSKL